MICCVPIIQCMTVFEAPATIQFERPVLFQQTSMDGSITTMEDGW